jgi:hypothetical protein
MKRARLSPQFLIFEAFFLFLADCQLCIEILDLEQVGTYVGTGLANIFGERTL